MLTLKKEMSQIRDLMMHLEDLEKQEETKPDIMSFLLLIVWYFVIRPSYI